MIHNAEKFNNKIMKNFFLLIKIIVVYLFLISNGISKETIYYSEGIKYHDKYLFATGAMASGHIEQIVKYFVINKFFIIL